MNTEVEERKLDPALALPVLDESAPREPHRQFALKHEDCFVVADSYGDIRGTGDGLFCDDTRVLSRFRLLIADRMPSLLGASLSQDNILFTANLTNLAAVGPNGSEVPASAVHIDRSRFIWQDRMFERITFTNYSAREIALPVRLDFDADFRDMFELRGTTRSRRGRAHDGLISEASVTFRSEGLDTGTTYLKAKDRFPLHAPRLWPSPTERKFAAPLTRGWTGRAKVIADCQTISAEFDAHKADPRPTGSAYQLGIVRNRTKSIASNQPGWPGIKFSKASMGESIGRKTMLHVNMPREFEVGDEVALAGT
ncbi:glycogen debranching N-terminal domain-containing protein, partial [Mesorhizobium sp. M0520]